MAAPKTTEEKKESLPVGHPQAGYVSPDLSFSDGAGTLPDEEKEWNEDRDAAREDDALAVAENEDKVAKAERKAAEGEAVPKATAAKSS